MTDSTDQSTPTPSQIAHAIAVANGHPDADTFVARFNAALMGDQNLPDYGVQADAPDPTPENAPTADAPAEPDAPAEGTQTAPAMEA
jgi:hypothetical protein